MTKHFRSLKRTMNEKAEKWQLVYSFALMDLNTRMYIGYTISMKSENDAYYRALEMIERSGIELNSVRADKYYLVQNISD